MRALGEPNYLGVGRLSCRPMRLSSEPERSLKFCASPPPTDIKKIARVPNLLGSSREPKFSQSRNNYPSIRKLHQPAKQELVPL
jgi:hypothetical protein